MRGNQTLIEQLNELLTIQLTAINQFFLHAKVCDHRGFERLGKHFRRISIQEMKDAEALTERILVLGGLPNYQRLDDFSAGENVAEQLELGIETEDAAVTHLEALITTCVEIGDAATRDLLEPMAVARQDHLDWLAAQIGLMAQVGDANFLAEQIRA